MSASAIAASSHRFNLLDKRYNTSIEVYNYSYRAINSIIQITKSPKVPNTTHLEITFIGAPFASLINSFI